MKMKITVKAAQYSVQSYFSRCGILETLIQQLHNLNPKVGKRALKLLENPNHKYNCCIFDPLHPICTPEETRTLRACVIAGYRERTVRSSLSFTVQPTLTVAALKSLLKPLPWIAKQNLLLVQNNARPLEDDNSTLVECNVKDRDSLLACMDGVFPLAVKIMPGGMEFAVPVSGCFETVHELKTKIYDNNLHPVPKDQKWVFQKRAVRHQDNTPLVALGIVRDLPTDSRRIEVYKRDERFVAPKIIDTSWGHYAAIYWQ